MLDNWYRALFILVIVLPFLGQAFPTPGAIPLFVPVALLFLPATLLLRIADRGVPGLLLGDPRFMAITEAAIRRAPEQWLWYHDRWRPLRETANREP